MALKEEIGKTSLIKLALLLYLLPLVLSESGSCALGASDLPKPFIYSTEELNNWVPPAEVRNALKYYYAGDDKKGRPVIIAQTAQWDLLGLTSTEEGRKLYRKAIEQFCLRLGGKSSWTDGTKGYVLIEQCENFSVRQLAGPYTIPAWLDLVELLESLIQEYNSSPNIMTINVNCAKDTLLGIIQLYSTVIGQYLQPFGTNKTEWIPKLDEMIPADQRPLEYGGSVDWKMIRSSYA